MCCSDFDFACSCADRPSTSESNSIHRNGESILVQVSLLGCPGHSRCTADSPIKERITNVRFRIPRIPGASASSFRHRLQWAPMRLSPSKIHCRKAASGISLPGSGHSSLSAGCSSRSVARIGSRRLRKTLEDWKQSFVLRNA